MDQKYIQDALKHAGIDVYQEDVPWIQYMINYIEPVADRLTPDYMKGNELMQPWVFEILTVDWR